MSTPAILVIHNYYRNKGGEDTVVMHETEALKKAGAKVYELYFHNPQGHNALSQLIHFFFGIYFNFNAYWKVYNLVRTKRIEIVHVHNLFYQASPSILWAARHAGAKVVVTLHNYRLFCLNALFFRDGKQCTLCLEKKSLRPGIRNACFRNSRWQSFFLASSLNLHKLLGSWHRSVHQFVIVNPAMQPLLESFGIKRERITLKPNCITDQHFTAYLHRGQHYLIASRLESEKGIPEVLEAWKELSLPLHVAGDGSLRSQVEAASKFNIRYLGFLDPVAMQREMATCKALIFSSKLMEGMPLSIIEAMASGAICIAQSTAVTRMLIENGVTGLLYDINDGGASFKKAVQALDTMSLLELNRMSYAARSVYEQRFSINEHIRRIAQVYGVTLNLPEEVRIAEMRAEAKALAV